MRKTCILIFLIFLVFSARVRAGFNDGILSITNLSHQHVLIEVDGRQYPDCNNALVIRDFTPGYHEVKVYAEKSKTFPFKRVTLYNKDVYVRPKYYVDIIINRFGHALIDEQEITDNRFDEDGCEKEEDKHHERPRPNYSNPVPIADNTFAALIEVIKKESFDDSRMAIARSGIDQHFFTSAQARQLITLLSFETSKLELAKYLYGKTTDQKNYFIVYSAFTFSKTKEELAGYIRNYK
jgi:hypothetical protein